MPDRLPTSLDSGIDDIAHIKKPSSGNGYLVAISSITLISVLAAILLPYLDLANIVMLFLLPVVVIAARYGRGPAILSTALGVAAFDYGFVPPRFSFEISDIQYLVTFSVMLAVGLLVSNLTSGLRRQAELAARRESLSRQLYTFSRDLSGSLEIRQIVETALRYIEATFKAKAEILIQDEDGHLKPVLANKDGNADKLRFGTLDMTVAQWAMEHAKPTGVGTPTLSSSPYAFVPLVGPMHSRGILAIRPEEAHWDIDTEQGRLLQTYAALTAIALERHHYVSVAQNALVHIESERLRNSILSALSHDLRTPLTALVGLSESLTISKPALPATQLELAQTLHEETRRMSNMVAKLLDMARIQSGKITLDFQWQYIDEVIGSALRACRPMLAHHQVCTRLAPELPPVRFDAVLVERVLCNLIENAVKYTPQGSCITIAATTRNSAMEIAVLDNGPGLPPGQEETLFEKFARGEWESHLTGTGLGLTICRAIVQAHQGEIFARNLPEGGASLVFTLPLGSPPELSKLPEDGADFYGRA